MRRHYTLRFHLFDGKTPLWWVETYVGEYEDRKASTNGYRNSGDAIRAAAKL